MARSIPLMPGRPCRATRGQRSAARRQQAAARAAEYRDHDRAHVEVADLDADRQVYQAYLMGGGQIRCEGCLSLEALATAPPVWLTGEDRCGGCGRTMAERRRR